ncbi:MAG TPA: hypothetical protein VMG10_01645 [Gemmataceae bacterium]|nr:hypothetical protein [Gemmataceae bacterium]
MTPLEEITSFAEQLKLRWSDVKVESFDAGGIFLDVRPPDRLFVLTYSPTHRMFCVDEITSDAAFDSGYRFGYPDFPSAKAKLLDLLDEAGSKKSGDTFRNG